MKSKMILLFYFLFVFFCFGIYANAETEYVDVLTCSNSDGTAVIKEWNDAKVCVKERDAGTELSYTCPSGYSSYSLQFWEDKIYAGYGCSSDNTFGGGSSRGAGAGGRNTTSTDIIDTELEYADTDVDDCVNSSCMLLCTYNNDNNKTYIYYDFKGTYLVKGKINGVMTNYSYDNSLVYFESLALNNLTKKGICPTRSYISQANVMGGTASVTTMCFENSSSYCSSVKGSSKFGGSSQKNYDYNNILTNFYNDYLSSRNDRLKNCDAIFNYETENTIFEMYDAMKDEIFNGHDIPLFIKSGVLFKNLYFHLLDTYEANVLSCAKHCLEDAPDQCTDRGKELSEKADDYIKSFKERYEDYMGSIPSSQNDSDKEITDYDDLCTSNEDVRKAFKIISTVILIAHWVIPLIIIVLGMIDFTKAVISDDEKATEKATTALIRRVIAGIVVFFIPTIITGLLNLIDITDGIMDNGTFAACTKCLFDNKKC